MLNCIYHPYLKMRVVDDNERLKHLERGWHDTPQAAKAANTVQQAKDAKDENHKGKQRRNGSRRLHNATKQGEQNNEQAK